MWTYREFAGVAFVIGLGILGLGAYQFNQASFDRGQRVDGIMSRYLADDEMAQYSRSSRRPARFDRTPYYVMIGIGGVAILTSFFLLGMGNLPQSVQSDENEPPPPKSGSNSN